MNNQELTNEERQALIIALKMLEPEIKGIPIPALSKAIEIALAALTAEPVKVPEKVEPDYEVIKRILPTANPDEYACCVGADMWNACRSEVLRLNK